MNNNSPIQFLPSDARVYPVLQEQIKLPTVLLQLCSHPSISRAHSSVSVTSTYVSMYITLYASKNDIHHTYVCICACVIAFNSL